MTIGEDWGWGASNTESQKIFDAFAEAGGNFIDTACNYTDGTSEKYEVDPNAGGNNRKNLMRSIEASLERLNTDYIDLL